MAMFLEYTCFNCGISKLEKDMVSYKNNEQHSISNLCSKCSIEDSLLEKYNKGQISLTKYYALKKYLLGFNAGS